MKRFFDSRDESVLIHRLPAVMEVGSVVVTDERGRLATCAAGVPCLPAAPGAQSGRRPAVFGSAAFLHGGECALAGASQGIRPLEHRLEALFDRLSKAACRDRSAAGCS